MPPDLFLGHSYWAYVDPTAVQNQRCGQDGSSSCATIDCTCCVNRNAAPIIYCDKCNAGECCCGLVASDQSTNVWHELTDHGPPELVEQFMRTDC
jgi:hypothetical protein